LKRSEHLLFILREDKGSERHVSHLLYVVRLVGPFSRSGMSLDLEHSPSRPIKQSQIQNSLNILRIVFEDNATRKQTFELLDEFTLIGRFSHEILLSLRKRKAKFSDMLPLSIIYREINASQYLKKIRWVFAAIKGFKAS
jgi:hypothetical protein